MPGKSARSATTLVASLTVAALFATGAQADEEIWKTVFRGSTEVNVVNIEVVVTDAEGVPLKGLTAADFELFENGEPVTISNFFAVEDGRTLAPNTPPESTAGESTSVEAEAEAQAEASRPLHMILYVDSVNIAPANRKRVFNAVREFLLQNRRLDSRIMLVSNERDLVVRQGFTSVPQEIFVALDEIENTSAASARFDIERRNLLRGIERINVEEASAVFDTKSAMGRGSGNDSNVDMQQEKLTSRAVMEARAMMTEVQAYTEQRLQHTHQTLDVLHRMVDTAAGLPGRKSILYVSDGLSLRPGDALNQAAARRFEALTAFANRFNPEAETSRHDATPALEALIAHANASQVTFYALDASPPESLNYGSAARETGSGGNFGSWNDGIASIEEYNDQATLRQLAEETGGLFGLTRLSYDAVLTSLFDDLGTYYSLGFTADRDPERDQRSIKVKVPGRDKLKVRYRKSFQDKSVAQKTIERTRAALLFDDLENPFDIDVIMEAAEPQNDGTFIVPVRVTVPLSKLVLLPGKSEHQGQVSMFVAVRDEQGRTSDVNRHLCPIRIPNDDVLTALGQRAACGMRLQMRSGPQRIAVSLLDELTSLDSTTHLGIDVGAEAQQAKLESNK